MDVASIVGFPTVRSLPIAAAPVGRAASIVSGRPGSEQGVDHQPRGPSPPSSPRCAPARGPYRAVVRHHVDGDTYDVLVDLGLDTHRYLTIRLLGVDTPETNRRASKAAGLAALAFVMDVMPVGQPLQRAVVHARLELPEVVHEQVPDPARWDAVAVDEGGDGALAGVALGRPDRAQGGGLAGEHAEGDHEFPGQVLAAVPAGGADDVGVVQQFLPGQPGAASRCGS